MIARQISFVQDMPARIEKLSDKYEQMAAKMTRGEIMPQNFPGYDVKAENYKYQVKYAHTNIGVWCFNFSLIKDPDYVPDFCILYGIIGRFTNCFFLPYPKVMSKIQLHSSRSGNIGLMATLVAGCNGWINDFRLRDETYSGFINRRNELELYFQMALL